MECVLVVGLGNPGATYRETRHNVGFMVLEELCTRWRSALREGRGEFYSCTVRRNDKDVVLLAPTTYMNNSGLAVKEAVELYGVTPDQCLVVADDFALPLGTLRLRRAGSDGGHHGLSSVVYHLGSDEFPRLRCGIGSATSATGEETASFVLSPFETGERETAAAMILRAADAVESFVEAGIDRTMNFYNKAP